MRRLLLLPVLFLLCNIVNGQGKKITELPVVTSAVDGSLLMVRSGTTGNTISQITKGNLFNGYALSSDISATESNLRYTHFYPSSKWNTSTKNLDATGGFNILVLGDSRAIMSYEVQEAFAKYYGLNGNGLIRFNHSTGYYGYLTANTASMLYFGDTTSNRWGVAGETWILKGSNYAKIYPYTDETAISWDNAVIYYRMASDMGGFKYKVNNGAYTVVDTYSTVDSLGYTVISNTDLSLDSIRIELDHDSCYIYGIRTYNSIDRGVTIDFLERGGSTTGQWSRWSKYLKEYIEHTQPDQIHLFTGVNDGGGVKGAAYIQHWIDTLKTVAPSWCDFVIYTAYPRGQDLDKCTENVSVSDAYRLMNDSIFAFSDRLGYSVLDVENIFPSRPDGCTEDFWQDHIHISETGQAYLSKYILNTAPLIYTDVAINQISSYREKPVRIRDNASYGWFYYNAGVKTDEAQKIFLDANNAINIRFSTTDTLRITAVKRSKSFFTDSSTPTNDMTLKFSGTFYPYALSLAGDITGGGTTVTSITGIGSITWGRRTVQTPSAVNNVAVAGISSGLLFYTVIRVQGDGGAIDITGDPQIADGTNGQIIEIWGESDTNTLKFDDGTGLQLAGGASITLGLGDCLRLRYISSVDIWREISRSDN